MMIAPTVLSGHHIRLEPLTPEHIPALAALAPAGAELYRWSLVPSGQEATTAYVETALAWQRAGTAIPFATVRQQDGKIIGSTRFFLIERWAWPAGDARHVRAYPDVAEIGYTWLAPEAIRTPANTEAKLLMLTHAFEHWDMLRICLHTDQRNLRSRAAMERIGANFEGILRAHRLAADGIARDSARYSITAPEWPAVKVKLNGLLAR